MTDQCSIFCGLKTNRMRPANQLRTLMRTDDVRRDHVRARSCICSRAYVSHRRAAKAQTSLRIRTVSSEPQTQSNVAKKSERAILIEQK